jgi:GTP-binding protein HflX
MKDDKKLKLSAKTLVLHPVFVHDAADPEYKLEEALGLAAAIELRIDRGLIVPIKDPKPDALFGGGKIAEMAEYIQNNSIELAYINTKLTPIQQRNLEKGWNTKVIDRSGMILEIFGARARTNEGKLQVELCLLYTSDAADDM